MKRSIADEEISLNNTAKAGLTSCGLLTQVTVDSTTRDALAGARVVSISVGGNDLLTCARDNYATIDELCAVTALARFQRNWPEILERLPIPDDGRLLAMTIYNPYPPDAAGAKEADIYISKMNAIIRSNVIQPYAVTVVDAYTRFRGWTADGDWRGCAWTGFCEARRDVHPNDLGYDELADLHWQAYAKPAPSQKPEGPRPNQGWRVMTPW